MSHGQVAVYAGRRRRAGLRDKEVIVHNGTASRASLAKSSGANPVSVIRSCVTLPPGDSIAIPRGVPPQEHRSHCPVPLAVGQHYGLIVPVKTVKLIYKLPWTVLKFGVVTGSKHFAD